MQTQDASILDINVTDPEALPKGTVKSMSWAPNASTPTFMTSDLASQIRIYNLNPGAYTLTQTASINTESPCLSASWCGDETRVVGGGLDHSVKLFDVATGRSDTVGYHEEEVKSVYWLDSMNQILSLSLDKTLRFWDPRQEGPTACYTLDHKVLCSDLLYPYLGVVLSEQKVMMLNIEDVETAIGTEHARQKNYMGSMLDDKRETVCIKVFNGDDLGIAVGGIDGRCNLSRVYEPEKTLAKLVHVITFLTYRREMDESAPPAYPINCLGFHPHMGKDFLYTGGGGDGKMHFWDMKKKDKIAEFDFGGVPVTQAGIDPTGRFLAYSLGGDLNEEGVGEGAKLCVHVLQERELRHKAVVEEAYPIKYP